MRRKKSSNNFSHHECRDTGGECFRSSESIYLYVTILFEVRLLF